MTEPEHPSHKYVPSCSFDNDETLCNVCMIAKGDHPGWSEKAQEAVIENTRQLEALWNRMGREHP